MINRGTQQGRLPDAAGEWSVETALEIRRIKINPTISRSEPRVHPSSRLAPRHFIPIQVYKRLEGWKVLAVLFFRADPQVDFHSGWIRLATRKFTLDRVMHLLRGAITRPLHHHEMGCIIGVQRLAIFQNIRSAPACQVQPGFGIQWVAVAGVTVFVYACGDASILEGLVGKKAVEMIRYLSAPS